MAALNKVVLMLTLHETKAPECRAVLNLTDDATPEIALQIAKDFSKTDPKTPFSAEYWDENGHVGFFECMNGQHIDDAMIDSMVAKNGLVVPPIEDLRAAFKASGLTRDQLNGVKLGDLKGAIGLEIPPKIIDLLGGPETTYGDMVGQ